MITRREFLATGAGTAAAMGAIGAESGNDQRSVATMGRREFEIVRHKVDFCVVGGGLAGMLAAIAAARGGARVALMHERPVLGGNASSEIRMHVCGAHGPNNRETGIIEEIHLENRYRNPARNYSLWDSVLFEKVRYQDNLTPILNCSCCALEMDGSRIRSVRGWQLTTQTWQEVEADYFADCSGDSVLAPLSGAAFRVGREAAAEFGEDIQPEQADRHTMGMSCLIQARETDRPQPFVAPEWANKYAGKDALPKRSMELPSTNFWWIELGGDMDSIRDTEIVRDELLKAALGVWDYIKNRSGQPVENWALDWVGFLPGKRESRRYEGDVIVTQNDVRAEGKFEDLVAYGGWSMDDHHPGGLRWAGKPTIFHKAPSPWGIPYRALYSRNIDNLWFAGRNLSATHAALSSSRVMATCAILGQAVGEAAAIAVRESLSPREVYEKRIGELRQALMDADCYLPWARRAIPELTRNARLSASSGDPEPLRNGLDRPLEGADNAWAGTPGASWVQYAFDRPRRVRRLRFVFDSDLNRTEKNQPKHYPLNEPLYGPPATLVRGFRVEALGPRGEWREIAKVENNYQRLVWIDAEIETPALRFIPDSTWGASEARLFAWDAR